jgi:hypothetical protein
MASYTTADYAAAIWAYPRRTLVQGTPPPPTDPTGEYAATLWAFSPRTVTDDPALGPYCFDPCEALQAWFRSQPALQALLSDGRLWEFEAVEGTRYPFAEYFQVSEQDEVLVTNDAGYKVVRTTLQLSCHGATGQAAKDLRRRFEAALVAGRDEGGQGPLAVHGKPALLVHPHGPRHAKGEGKGPGGKDSYMSSIEIDVQWTQPVPVPTR